MNLTKRLLSAAICAAMTASVIPVTAYAEALPSSYDLRKIAAGDVKNQGLTSSCWAFGGTGILETWLKLNGYGDYDLSERHMDMTTAGYFADEYNTVSDFADRQYSMGGNTRNAVSYYYSGIGPVLEKDYAFIPTYEGTYSDVRSNTECKTAGISVKDIVIGSCAGDLSMTSVNKTSEIIQQMKRDIKENGAISAAYYVSDDIQEETYYYSTSFESPNHAIMIVGWNDSYPKEKFVSENGYNPQNDGAWIVKNSWGSDVQDNGYFYMSYETYSLYRESYFFIERADKTDYDDIYLSCSLSATTYETASTDDDNTDYSANIFTRSPNAQSLTEVTLALREDSDYEVFVIPSYTGTSDLSKGISVAKGTAERDCYKTVEFDPVSLTGDKFAVVVKYHSDDRDKLLVPKQENIYTVSYYLGNDFTGTSFVSHDGKKWTDTAKQNDTMVFLRAYTVNDNKTSNISFKSNPDYITAKLYKGNAEVNKNPDGSFDVEKGTYTYEISEMGYETTKGTVTADGKDKTVNVSMKYCPGLICSENELGLKDSGKFEIYLLYGLNGETAQKAKTVKINGKSVKFTQTSEGIFIDRSQLTYLKAGQTAKIAVTYANKTTASLRVSVVNRTAGDTVERAASAIMKKLAKVTYDDIGDIDDIITICENTAKKYSKDIAVSIDKSEAEFTRPTSSAKGSYSFNAELKYNGSNKIISVNGEIAQPAASANIPTMGSVKGWDNIVSSAAVSNAVKNGGKISIKLGFDGKVPAAFWNKVKGSKAKLELEAYDGAFTWNISCANVKKAADTDMTVYSGRESGVYDDSILDSATYSLSYINDMKFYIDSSMTITGDLTIDVTKYINSFTGKMIYKDELYKYKSGIPTEVCTDRTIITYHSGKTTFGNVSGGSYLLMFTTDRYVYGDIDFNTEGPDSSDYKSMVMYVTYKAVDPSTLNPLAFALLDVNEDGKVDNDDVTALKKYIEAQKKKSR